jgi:hypothetical protein
MIGTPRPHVKFFMDKFRKIGFLKYNAVLQVNTSRLSVGLLERQVLPGP